MSVYIKEPSKPAQACIIWLHGLGADASDMVNLAEQLVVDAAVRYVFLDAPKRPVTLNGGMVMPAWYDILGVELSDREDKKGIEESEAIIRQVLEEQISNGLNPSQIFLAGFSQGAAMAIHTALNTAEQLGGVIALSGYLPLATETKPVLNKATPLFIGGGQFDPLVLPKWTQATRDWLLSHGYAQIAYHQYPMEHSVCFQEIKDISLWLNRQIRGALQ